MGIKAAATVAMVLSMAVGAVGCGAATHARRGALGGEVRVHGVHGTSDAHVLMAEHCGGRFLVVTEEEGRAIAGRDAAAGKPTVAEVDIGGEAVHYLCASRPAVSAR